MDWAMKEKSYSQRRGCALAEIDPCVYRRRPTGPEDSGLRQRLKELSGERRRFGYRRLHILLKHEGWELNWSAAREANDPGDRLQGGTLYRIYREEGLTVRKRGGRKRAIGTRAPMAVPQGPNQRWSLDFVSDTLSDDRRFRILCVIDDFSRECLATVVDTSLSGLRVARELDADRRSAWLSLLGGVRQWHRTDQQRDPEMAAGPAGRMALHRARQTDAERFRGELQWPPSG